MTLKSKIDSVVRHPFIIGDIARGKKKSEIRARVRAAEEQERERQFEIECRQFIAGLKSEPYVANSQNLHLNKLCCIEDWENAEVKELLPVLQSVPYHEKNRGLLARVPGQIHRKDWEWALGIIAMRRFGKLSKDCAAIGIGAGKELVLFYLANHLSRVHATDLYDTKEWASFAPSDFPENPQKYAPFPYDESALAVSRMDATSLSFPSDSFDVAFSFSSIEHFGGENHSGALQSVNEIGRILKPGGIAVIATEYIINGKQAPDLSNQFYNSQTIYSDLIDRVDNMRLVEPLDLRISSGTLDTAMDVRDAEKWDRNEFGPQHKAAHPYILLRSQNILLTSVMLVFQKP